MYENIKLNNNIVKNIPLECNYNFIDGPFVEITNGLCNYDVEMYSDGRLAYKTILKKNMWGKSYIKYFCNWNIKIFHDGKCLKELTNNLKNKNVQIINESGSLGDCIAFMPVVDTFQKKHECILDYYTPNKQLFEKTYTNINFYNYGANTETKYFSSTKIGCFDPEDRNIHKRDHRTLNLQEMCCDLLGLPFIEKKPKLFI